MVEQVLTVAGALLAAEEEPALQLLHHHVLQKVTNPKFQKWIWYKCPVDIYSLGTEENIDLISSLQHDILQNLTKYYWQVKYYIRERNQSSLFIWNANPNKNHPCWHSNY